MENYIVLDIESPNTYYSSVSAIGILIIKNNKITDKIYSLINPEDEFEDEIIDLTGITPEMVKDKPKFNEFWPEIEELLVTNIIIGHNISYDLEVISNSLKNYNINVPNFKYICTLKLSYTLMTNLSSYSLQSIMNELNYEYDAHNALADSEAAYYLFNYLNKIKEVTIINQQIFNNNGKNESINEELYPNINQLYGSILEFRYKSEITENQIKIFQDWIEKNRQYSYYKKIQYIIIKLNSIISHKFHKKEDMINISTIVTSINKSEKYSKEELNYQVWTGIIKMYNSDNNTNNEEAQFLKKWLTYYSLPENIDVSSLMKSLNIQ